MSRTHILIIAVVMTCALAAGIYVFALHGRIPFMNYGTKTAADQEAFRKDFNKAISSHSDKNYDAAIAEFEALLPRAQNKADIASIQNKIAINYINKGLATSEYNDHVKKGMDLLWSVALGQDNPALQRATAINDLGTIASYHDTTFYKTYYTIPPFSTLITDEKDAYANLKAALKIFKYADDLSPNPYAEFSIVRIYTHLLANGVLEAGSTNKEMAKAIQQYIAEGDTSLAASPNYREGAKLQMLLDRAKGFVLAAYTLHEKTPQEREDAYKTALETGLSYNQNDKYVMDAEMELRFWYAGYLAKVYGKERQADIQSLVASFKPGTVSPETFTTTRMLFVVWSNQKPYTNLGQSLAVKIAELSPDFKEFLVSVGWKL